MAVDTKLDILEDKINRIELKVEQLKLSEILAKGEKILEIYELLKAWGVIDTLYLLEEINNLKHRMLKIEKDPIEWLKSNEEFKRSLMIMINRKILEEVRNIGLFHLYKDDPTQLVKTVKDAVKEYLEIWELNDQVAKELVERVILEKMYSDILSNIIEDAKKVFGDAYKEKRRVLDELREEVMKIDV